jgi:hypothetical protein
VSAKDTPLTAPVKLIAALHSPTMLPGMLEAALHGREFLGFQNSEYYLLILKKTQNQSGNP